MLASSGRSRLLPQRELSPDDKSLQKAMHKRVGAALRNLRERTLVQSRSGAGGRLEWSLANLAGDQGSVFEPEAHCDNVITKPDAQLEGGWRTGSG